MRLAAFIKAYGTEEACRAHMENVRWPAGPVCPKCASVNDAVPISTRPGQFRCRPCGKHFTVTVGTAMEGSHLPLHVWYLAMYLMLSTAKPISATSLSTQLGIQYRTCWYLLRRLRARLAVGEKLPLAGLVGADEPDAGGKASSRQKRRKPGKRWRGTDKPTPANSQNDLREFTAPSELALRDWIGRAATLLTNELATYCWIRRKMKRRYTANPAKSRSDLRGTKESFGLFKRCLIGPHGRLRLRDLFA